MEKIEFKRAMIGETTVIETVKSEGSGEYYDLWNGMMECVDGRYVFEGYRPMHKVVKKITVEEEITLGDGTFQPRSFEYKGGTFSGAYVIHASRDGWFFSADPVWVVPKGTVLDVREWVEEEMKTTIICEKGWVKVFKVFN